MDSRISLEKSRQEIVRTIEESRKWEKRYQRFMACVAVFLVGMLMIMITWMITESESIFGMPGRVKCWVGPEQRKQRMGHD